MLEENFLLPEEIPDEDIAAANASQLKKLWKKYEPFKFDLFSAGVVLMQLGCPALQTSDNLPDFDAALARCNYDLKKCRKKFKLESPVLDANDGAGWDLAAALLCRRDERITAKKALKHPFLKS